MTEFAFSPLLRLAEDDTPYRKISSDHVSRFSAHGKSFLEIEPQALTLLTRVAMDDIAFLLRPGHLAQLRAILDDAEASPNDHVVALELLKNASIAAGRVFPGCQDTGTAIVMAHKGQWVITGGGDEEAIARGVFDTQRRRLRQQELPVSGEQEPLEPQEPGLVRGRKNPHARHRCLPALPPRAGDRRPQRRAHHEDRQARFGALSRHAADLGRRFGPAIRSSSSRSSRSRARRASARSSAASTSATTCA
jgi:hypothetical protein